jgi:hypothetical protein
MRSENIRNCCVNAGVKYGDARLRVELMASQYLKYFLNIYAQRVETKGIPAR